MDFLRSAVTGFLVLILASNGLSQQKNPMIEKLLKDARQKFAPDKRLQVFDVRAVFDSTTLTVSGEVQSAELRDRLIEYLKGQVKGTVVDSLVALPHPALGK